MPLNNPAFRAAGKIYPSRFVTIDGGTNADFTILQANGGGSPLIGISQDGSKLAPGVQARTTDDLYAADVNDPIQVYGETDVCLVWNGTADIKAGDLLTADAEGRAVKAADGDWVGAIALEHCKASNAVYGNLCRVQVKFLKGGSVAAPGVVAPPTVTLVNPSEVFANSGVKAVQILGTNFTADGDVLVDGESMAAKGEYQFVGATEVRFGLDTSALTAGATVAITLKAAGGEAAGTILTK
jgi:hypothetical protein